VSGIAVLFDREQDGVGREDVEAMLDRIDHRGPDGRGAWHDGRVSLGHQHLASTPEGAFDDQPVCDGDLVVTADARLDNRPELLDELSVGDEPAKTPDSQLLLEAYRTWGDACVEQFAGSFAFAVWDLSRERLFCARDHFGVKPLYYYHGDDVFAIASEKKAVLALPTVAGEVDETKIGDFLIALYEDKERTFFESLRRLPPAHALVVDTDGANRWQYWDLDPTRTVTLSSDAAYERRFRDLFEQAVQSRLRSSGTVGTDLSGGLDSSAVTAVARTLLPPEETLHTFSTVFEETPASDEREFFETLTGRNGLHSHRVSLDETSVFGDRDRVFGHFDHPPHDTTQFAKWARLEAVERAGIDVHLTGEAGDSAIGHGLGLLPELLRTGRWLRLVRELREIGSVVGAPTHVLFRQNALDPLVPSAVDRLVRRLRGKPVLAKRANPTLAPSFVDAYDLQTRYRSFDRRGSVFTRSARRLQHRSLTSGRITAMLETIDLLYALFGVEPRHPFTDHRLVEYTLAIPPGQQLADGYTRSILRRSLGDLLPEKIQWRPWKAMLGTALWTKLAEEDDALRRLVQSPEPLTRYLDPGALRESYEEFDDEPGPAGRHLWKALSLSLWLETHE